MKKFALFCVLIILFFSKVVAAPVEIIFWHSLAGEIGKQVEELAQGFNKSQNQFFIKPVYKGDYIDTLTSFAAAFAAKQPPALVQVFEVGTATMLSPSGIIKPTAELIKEQGLSLPAESFLPAVRAFYSKNGELQAMPFNLSVPVIFYNKKTLGAVGITSANFPKTWQEMDSVFKKLHEIGYACAYTSAYPAWIQVESFAALHGIPLIDGKQGKAIYNNPLLIHHLQRLKKWQENHYFKYGGRTDDATALFTSGYCPLFSQSSGSYNSLKEIVKFPVGVAPLPIDRSLVTRHNNVVGGAAIWAVAGQSNTVYRGIALFYIYLALPETQKQWQKNTGYLPIGLTHTYASLLKEDNPILKIAQFDLSNQEKNTFHPYRIPQNQIRIINDEALEAIFAGIKLPKQAIDDAVAQANFAILRFGRNVG